jgi:hypothetical protein
MSAQFAPANVNETYSPKRWENEIEVFRTKLPAREYIEIGIVNASGSGNINFLIEGLKKEAAKNGGDAIIDIEPYPGGVSATVIRYVE